MWGKGPDRGALGRPFPLTAALGHSRRDPAKRLSRVPVAREEIGSSAPLSLLQPQFKLLSLPLFPIKMQIASALEVVAAEGCPPPCAHRPGSQHGRSQKRALEMGLPKPLSSSRRYLQAQSILRFSFKHE